MHILIDLIALVIIWYFYKIRAFNFFNRFKKKIYLLNKNEIYKNKIK